MTRTRRVIIGILATVGAVTVLAAVVGGFVTLRARVREQSPRPSDLAYILNWADLGDITKLKTVQCAYASERNWLVGDQTKVYVVQLEPFDPAAFARPKLVESWTRGPVTESLYVKALETASLFAANTLCKSFPSLESLNTTNFYLSFPQVTAYSGRTEVAVVTAYDLRTGVLYHADVRW